jgi:hypothetical protein
VRLPGHIYLHTVGSIDRALANCPSGQELQEACIIWQHLAWLLIKVHDRGIVLRDLQKSNVVRARTEGGGQWTLLEFGNATRPGAMALSVTARTSPPEVRFVSSFSGESYGELRGALATVVMPNCVRHVAHRCAQTAVDDTEIFVSLCWPRLCPSELCACAARSIPLQ